MRKQYIKPETSAILLQVEGSLLSASLTLGNTSDAPTVKNEEEILSEKKEFVSPIWGE